MSVHLSIDALLSGDDAARLEAAVLDGELVEGRITAGEVASEVKQNLQLVPGSELERTVGQAVLRALQSSEALRSAARPAAILPPLVAVYRPGMSYGEHLDNAIMARAGRRIRCDVSLTVFLSAPESYDGGELVVESEYGELRYKGAAGSAIVYPSGDRHRVEPVTRGQRVVAVTWIQSLVRDATGRRVLHDLSTTIDELRAEDADAAALRHLRYARDELLRMWAEP